MNGKIRQRIKLFLIKHDTGRLYEELSSCFDIHWYRIFRTATSHNVNTVFSLKMTAFWDVPSCSLVEVDRRFRGAYCLQ